MTESLDMPESASPGASTPWAALLRRVGLARELEGEPLTGPSDAAHASEMTEVAEALAPLAIGSHAELFMSERTGDWIRVGCDCALGVDHWHLAQAE